MFPIFFFFSARGGGNGESEAPGDGGGRLFVEKSRGGGGLQEGEGPRGRAKVSAVNRRVLELWGGGAKFFFFGAEMSAK